VSCHLGQLSPVKLNRAMEAFRFVEQGSFKLEAAPNSLYYLLGNHITYSNLLYNKAAIDLPMILDCRPVKVGKTSLDLCHTLFLDQRTDCSKGNSEYIQKTNESFLASRILRCVCMDPATKRSKAIPDEDKKFLSEAIGMEDLVDSENFPQIDLPEDVPCGAYTCEILPRFEDMDWYFHINQGFYLEFCQECAARAAMAGALPHFTTDICFRLLKTATNLFSAETFPTDMLHVSTWEDAKDHNTLYFIVKKGSTLVFRAKFVYFPSEEG